MITIGGHIVKNDLPYIKLLARENDMNKPSSLVTDLGIVSEEIAWWNQQWKCRKEEGEKCYKEKWEWINLPSGESLYLKKEGRNTLNKTRHAKDTSDRLRGDEKRMAIHDHSKCNVTYNRVHVSIEHLYKMRVVSPSEKEQSLIPSLTNDGGEKSILKGSKVDWTLNLDATVVERSVKARTILLTTEALPLGGHPSQNDLKKECPEWALET